MVFGWPSTAEGIVHGDSCFVSMAPAHASSNVAERQGHVQVPLVRSIAAQLVMVDHFKQSDNLLQADIDGANPRDLALTLGAVGICMGMKHVLMVMLRKRELPSITRLPSQAT